MINPIETHPLKPFLPADATLLMLGSFPPQRKRWSMEFYYPNLNNDMWRIMGLIFFNDKEFFVDGENKRFRLDEIIKFLANNHIALYDTAFAVRRLNDNASDKFLEVVQQTDLRALLTQIPECKTVVATGQKATDIIVQQFDIPEPAIGFYSEFSIDNRSLRFYRMPSSSRAYPLKLETKAEFYRKLFSQTSV
ncbi:MAG: uracil-DNA glycosylase family protein [Tannerella sp.]|jgi:G:T/U-mismatch repair DNA glycosylase|nr:uracil-DNA glycosylase family protein [Tannerella sp.]